MLSNNNSIINHNTIIGALNNNVASSLQNNMHIVTNNNTNTTSQNINRNQLHNQHPVTTPISNMNIVNYNNMYSLQNIRSPLLQNTFNSIRLSVKVLLL